MNAPKFRAHGVAVGVVHTGPIWTPQKRPIKLCCTTVSTENTGRGFDIHDDLSFTTSLTVSHEIYTTFIRLVGIFEQVVAKQEQSCRDACVAYQPIAIYAGGRANDPMPYKDISRFLFGDTGEYQCTHPKSNRNLLVLSENPETFRDALEKLETLLQKAVWITGSYNNGPFGNSKKTTKAEILKKLGDRSNAYILRLIHDKDENGAIRESSLFELKEMAFKEGKRSADLSNEDESTFAIPSGIEGYEADSELQKKYPAGGAYLTCHPEVFQAFLQGFHATYTGKRYRNMKIPTDKPQPFFADPCADVTKEVVQVTRGERTLKAVLDEPDVRKRLGELALQARQALQSALGEGGTPLSANKVAFLRSIPFQDCMTMTGWYKGMRAVDALWLNSLVEFMRQHSAEFDDPQYTPSEREKAIIAKMAGWFDASISVNNTFEQNLRFLRQTAEDFKSHPAYRPAKSNSGAVSIP